jgi:hypothetical protein
MFTPVHPSLEYEHPYRRRTFWRVLLPRPFCSWVDKGEDCQSVGAEHQGWLYRDRIDFGASRTDDLIGDAEDFWALFSGITSALKPFPRLR